MMITAWEIEKKGITLPFTTLITSYTTQQVCTVVDTIHQQVVPSTKQIMFIRVAFLMRFFYNMDFFN